MSDLLEKMQQKFGGQITILYRIHSNEIHLVVPSDKLLPVVETLHRENFYPVTVVSNDERELEEVCFKIYYLFSHEQEDEFVIVEYALPPESKKYPSLRRIYPGVAPFEREIGDMMGLFPVEPALSTDERGQLLHPSRYPDNLYPLRRDRSTPLLQSAIYRYQRLSPRFVQLSSSPAEGEWTLTVGPVHAATIEPGQFSFQLAGEAIEDFSILLGYTHKGIERLFQVGYQLDDGWQLAERIVGDSAYAHSLAYCHAVERLANVSAPPIAEVWRGIFLELERVVNHIADCAGMAADVSLHTVANELLVTREQLLRLNQKLTGHRWLRGINRPGGIMLPKPINETTIQEISATITRVMGQCSNLGTQLIQKSGFRDRTIDVGVLSKEQAEKWSANGFIARASGVKRDFRQQHPWGAYRQLQAEKMWTAYDAYFSNNATGDVFSRLHLRMTEVKISANIINKLLTKLPSASMAEKHFINPIDFSAATNFEFAIGYASGWRGDVVYWLMKDKFAGIYRCKVCDPSIINWQVMQVAIRDNARVGNPVSIADFPLLNKSFNLSYSGHDL